MIPMSQRSQSYAPRFRRSLRVLAGACVAALPVVAFSCADETHETSFDEAPLATQGFRMTAPPYAVGSGVETQRCYFFAVPEGGEAGDTYVNRIVLTQFTGSHHLNVFRVNTVKALGGKAGDTVVDGECWKSPNWSDWPLVINSQQSEEGKGRVEFSLPQGVAHRFKKGELLMVQSHYVNATTQVTPKEARFAVDFYTTPADKVTAELGTLFATNQHIKVCPGQTDVSYTASCKFGKDVTIVGANGHFHSRGKKFDISQWDATLGQATSKFYTSEKWDDPPLAWGLDIPVKAGNGVSYTCDFSAPSDACGDPMNQCCYTFGGKVETNEHCNAFVYYYPKGTDIQCF